MAHVIAFELEADIFRKLLLIAGLGHEVAQEIYNFFRRFFSGNFTEIFSRQIFQSPERYADFLGTLSGNVFARLNIVDRFLVSQLKIFCM